MSAATRILLIIACSLVAFGLITVAVALAALRFDLTGFATSKYEPTTHVISEDFESISIDTDTADISLLPSDDGTCRVVCSDQKDLSHTVGVNNGTLEIHLSDTRRWYQYISLFSIGKSSVTVYLPKAEYNALTIVESTGDINVPKDISFSSIDLSLSTGDVECFASARESVRIKTTTGDILVRDIETDTLETSVSTGYIEVSGVECAGDVKIKVTTGDAEISDLTCLNLSSEGSTGDIVFKRVVCEGRWSAERSTGSVGFDACDAAEIFIKTDTGDVYGSLISEKVFIAHTDTGRVSVPRTLSGGVCEVITDTGDIQIYLSE